MVPLKRTAAQLGALESLKAFSGFLTYLVAIVVAVQVLNDLGRDQQWLSETENPTGSY